ncbi:MAG: hypothetical protein ABI601_09205 [bacterium]
MTGPLREQTVSIRVDDLRHVAELTRLRIPYGDAERHRVARVRSVLVAAAELNRALSTYTHHALIDCHGTTGAADLDADAIVLGEAWADFSLHVRQITEEYRSVMTLRSGMDDRDLGSEGRAPATWRSSAHDGSRLRKDDVRAD